MRPDFPKCAGWLTAVFLALGSATTEAELPDPTRPYVYQSPRVAAAPRLQLNAIIVSDERKLAIIDGKRLRVGDDIGGATLVSISKNEVELERGGQKLVLSMHAGQFNQ